MNKIRCVTERLCWRLSMTVALAALTILATACQSTSQGFSPFSGIFRRSAPKEATRPDPEPGISDSAEIEIEGLQDRVLEEASYRRPDMIDLSVCVRGLEGRLATGLVGQYMDRGGPDPSRLDLDEPAPAAGLPPAPSSGKSARSKPKVTGELLVSAYSQTGQPFKTGGLEPRAGFDGPGLINWVYAQNGIKVPQTARDLVAKGEAVARENLRPGDVVAYDTPKSTEYLVGIYTGNGNFILASSKFKVVTETAAFGTDFGPYFLGGRRYVDDPEAAPLNDDLKTAVTNGAVKSALLNLGDNVPKPANIYGGTVKKTKASVSRKTGSSKKAVTRKKTARRKG